MSGGCQRAFLALSGRDEAGYPLAKQMLR